MLYGIYQSAAGMRANQYRQDVLANNLANASTPGFKPDLALVRERSLAQAPGEPAFVPAGAEPATFTWTDFGAGPVERTGNPLDVAIAGDGFFAVQTPDGPRYTRDGRFTLNAQGELVTVAGSHPVLNAQGEPIVLPPGMAGRARIDAGGHVRAGGADFGRIGVVRFEDTNDLYKTGGNLFAAGVEPEAVAADLLTGAVEASAVDPVRAMVAMIEVTRAYQLNATLAGLADATLGRAVNDIARIR
jgi:flagellar basal-body rod protein FlgF